MSRVDTAWLRMDNDVNLMMIVGVVAGAVVLGVVELAKRLFARTKAAAIP